jgi:hypothetical protein
MLQLICDAAASTFTDEAWKVIAQSGFNAILVVLLLYFGRLELKEIRKEMQGHKRAMDRNTKLVTIALLQLASLLPGVRGQLQEIKQEIDEEDHHEKG